MYEASDAGVNDDVNQIVYVSFVPHHIVSSRSTTELN